MAAPQGTERQYRCFGVCQLRQGPWRQWGGILTRRDAHVCINNCTYGGTNYTTGGINAVFGYRWNEHWSAYAYVQKAINNNHILPYRGYGNTAFGYPYWGGFGWRGYGYRPFGYLPATAYNRAMDRIGGGVTYQWGENNQNSITVNVEMLHQP